MKPRFERNLAVVVATSIALLVSGMAIAGAGKRDGSNEDYPQAPSPDMIDTH